MLLAGEGHKLSADNNRLAFELERRKEFIVSDDKAWGAMRYMAQEFGAYGFEVGAKIQGKPCTILFTAPSDSLSIASAVASLAGATSGCRVIHVALRHPEDRKCSVKASRATENWPVRLGSRGFGVRGSFA
jgi:hypothetical protein